MARLRYRPDTPDSPRALLPGMAVGLRRCPRTGLSRPWMENFLVSGRKTAGNGLLGAGGEPFGRQASAKAGSANLHPAHLPSRSVPSAVGCQRHRTAGPLAVGNSCRPVSVRLCPSSGERVRHSLRCSFRLDRGRDAQGVRKKREKGKPVIPPPECGLSAGWVCSWPTNATTGNPHRPPPAVHRTDVRGSSDHACSRRPCVDSQFSQTVHTESDRR